MMRDLTTAAREQTDRPLVTFALFAYNQERYVREAIEGALSQTYEPLEIILSDDCSTDRTFKIMQDMAAAYSGPHQIFCRQNRQNIGTYNHLIAVAREAQGGLLIVNAGDDISYSHRADMLAEAWLRTGATALTSGYDEINEQGALQRFRLVFPFSNATQIVFGRSRIARKHDGYVLSVPGFCAAYDTVFLKGFAPCPERLLIEDGTISGVINCLGLRIHQLETPLIAYRIHLNSTTVREVRPDEHSILEREQAISRASHSIKLMIEQIFTEVHARGGIVEAQVANALMRGLRYADCTHEFWKKTLSARLATLASCRSKEDLRFVLPRLFGFKVFLALKKLNRKLVHYRQFGRT